jgi:hypothetical protein
MHEIGQVADQYRDFAVVKHIPATKTAFVIFQERDDGSRVGLEFDAAQLDAFIGLLQDARSRLEPKGSNQ